MNYLDRADERYEELRDEGLLSRTFQIPTSKYKKNLRVRKEVGNGTWRYIIKSYDTDVAYRGEDGRLIQTAYYSRTTQKHINYVAKEFGWELIRLDKLTDRELRDNELANNT